MGFLTGKTAIITGAGRAVLSDGSCGSIGYGIATAFAKEGANLVIFEFFKYMIAFRKRFHIITDSRGKATCSYPPVSIHSNVAWSAKYYDDTRMIGVMYAGVSLKQQGLDEFVYFGINAYWDYVNVELPDLPEGYHWKLYINTGNEPQDVILEDRNVILYDRRINMAGRSVIVAVGERY